MMVEFQSNGGTTSGFMAAPESGSGPGVLVLQEWWGLVDHIKDVCNRLAAAGFTALAPDMYHGDCAADPDEAGRKMMALEVPKVAADLRGAVQFLHGHDAVTSAKLGIMGFGLGGQLALFGACESPDEIGACVSFYGIHPNIKPDLTKLSGPVLGHFAASDALVTPEVARELAQSLSDAGQQFDFKLYNGIDHAFFNDTLPGVHDTEAAADAWARTTAFLRTNLA